MSQSQSDYVPMVPTPMSENHDSNNPFRTPSSVYAPRDEGAGAEVGNTSFGGLDDEASNPIVTTTPNPRRFFGAAGEGSRGSYATSGASSPAPGSAYYSGDEDSARGIRLAGGIPAGAPALDTPYRDDPNAIDLVSNERTSSAAGAGVDVGEAGYRDSGDAFDKEAAAAAGGAGGGRGAAGLADRRDRMLDDYAQTGKPGNRRRKFLLIGAIAALIIIAVAVAVPVAVTHKSSSSSNAKSGDPSSPKSSPSPTGPSGGGGGGGPGQDPPSNGPVTGGDGSIITMEDGTKFTYRNPFGGVWYDDPNDPFNNNAQAQSWVPPLNQSWDWNKNRVFGVNLGGWLVIEPFITPSYFEKYNGTVDEWTLMLALDADPNSGGAAQVIENHYNTFITEQDFAEIAGAGLSWVRIPFPFWAIETRNDEPFLEGVAWKYFLKAIKWARKYGLRIKLDLHTMPGSQNGYNHSGRLGLINWLNGVMGIANAQRGLEYIRVLTEFISQEDYADIVPLFGFVNEAVLLTITKDVLSHFYLETHDMIRNITGIGAGHGPYISIHDGFQGTGSWAGYMTGADRVILDSHPYLCFVDQIDTPLAQQAARPCQSWANSFNTSMSAFGITIAGEWAMSFTDCGKYLNGVGAGTRWEGTFYGYKGLAPGSIADGPNPNNCTVWNDWENYTPATITALSNFAKSSMDSFPHWFFWTWKIANSSITNSVEAPMWSYQLGLQQGWMPSDPRVSIGSCPAQGVSDPFHGPLKPSQTGGQGAGTIAPTFRESFGQWPPTSLANIPDATLLPIYTPTGAVPTLPPPTYTMKNGATTVGGNGWFDSSDTAGAPVNITGCTYPDAWAQSQIPMPTIACPSPSNQKRVPAPMMTPAPLRS